MNDFVRSIFNHLFPIFLYFFVGLGATIVEWTCFYIFYSLVEVHYQIATIFAIVISTFSNWALGRIFLFRNEKKTNLMGEIGKIYFVSIIGLLFNILLMWFFVEKIMLNEMVSKVLATCVVFIYNYLIRKLYIYKSS